MIITLTGKVKGKVETNTNINIHQIVSFDGPKGGPTEIIMTREYADFTALESPAKITDLIDMANHIRQIEWHLGKIEHQMDLNSRG